MADDTVNAEVEQREAKEGFLAGVAQARGEAPPVSTQVETPKKEEPQPKVDPQPHTEKPADKVPQEFRDYFDARFRSFEGRLGRVLNWIDETSKQTKSVGAPAPTQAQVATAVQDPVKWKKLKEDFQDWGEAIDERLAVERESIIKSIPKIDETKFLSRAELDARDKFWRQRNILDSHHDGWEEVSASKEFIDFAYEGGPSAEERTAYEQLRNGVRDEGGRFISPPNSARAEQMFKDFGLKYPQWWAERGALYGSPLARDAAKLLKAFADKKNVPEPPQQNVEERKQRESRLEAALTPKGVPAVTQVGVSDHEAFLRGVNKSLSR